MSSLDEKLQINMDGLANTSEYLMLKRKSGRFDFGLFKAICVSAAIIGIVYLAKGQKKSDVLSNKNVSNMHISVESKAETYSNRSYYLAEPNFNAISKTYCAKPENIN